MRISCLGGSPTWSLEVAWQIPRKLNIHLATLTPHIIRRIVNRELWTCYHTLASFFCADKASKITPRTEELGNPS